MTLTVFNQPHDLGNCFIKEGNMANNANGMAKAMAKPPIPTAGASVPPQEAASTNRVPIMGPVQEKETKTNVNAMKKIAMIPVAESAFLSSLLLHDAGRVISKAPKKETAKRTRSAKNSMLNKAFVAKSLRALAPNSRVISKPTPT